VRALAPSKLNDSWRRPWLKGVRRQERGSNVLIGDHSALRNVSLPFFYAVGSDVQFPKTDVVPCRVWSPTSERSS